jgi:F-type H+-transporting ATPase subunit epsilon
MLLTLTSITGIALKTEAFEKLTIATLDGTITMLPGHEPLISALKPGVMTVWFEGQKKDFAIGGGILETDGKDIKIIADMIEDGGHDLEEIAARKAKAMEQMKEYEQKGDPLSLEAYIELEQELLRDIAREQLAGK